MAIWARLKDKWVYNPRVQELMQRAECYTKPELGGFSIDIYGLIQRRIKPEVSLASQAVQCKTRHMLYPLQHPAGFFESMLLCGLSHFLCLNSNLAIV